MLSQSHSVNTSIESYVTHFLRWKESQSQSEKNALCERTFNQRCMEKLHYGCGSQKDQFNSMFRSPDLVGSPGWNVLMLYHTYDKVKYATLLFMFRNYFTNVTYKDVALCARNKKIGSK